VVGDVGNLDELLRSPRVAPKAVSAVLPDMAATLPALREDLESARRALGVRFASSATDAVCVFILGEVQGLDQALAQATPNRRPLNASTRLALERKVEKLQQRLLGALPLWELMVELWTEPTLPIDVHELLVLLREGDQSHGLRGEAIQVGLQARKVPVWLQCSPRAALTLIAIAAGVVRANQPSDGLCIEVDSEADSGRATLAIASRAPVGPLLRLVVPPAVPPTRSCLEATARAIGVDVDITPQHLVLAWDAPSPP
jgi:hypothetical protein